MEYDESDLLEIAYSLITADEETAEMIELSLSDRQLERVLQLKERIEKNWSAFYGSR